MNQPINSSSARSSPWDSQCRPLNYQARYFWWMFQDFCSSNMQIVPARASRRASWIESSPKGNLTAIIEVFCFKMQISNFRLNCLECLQKTFFVCFRFPPRKKQHLYQKFRRLCRSETRLSARMISFLASLTNDKANKTSSIICASLKRYKKLKWSGEAGEIKS